MMDIHQKIKTTAGLLFNKLNNSTSSGLHVIVKNTMTEKFLFHDKIANPENDVIKINSQKFHLTEKIFAGTNSKPKIVSLIGAFYVKSPNGVDEYLCAVSGLDENGNHETCISILQSVSEVEKNKIVEVSPNWVKELFVPKL